MARFYANENFPYAVVRQLRNLGHDVLTVAEAGNAGQRIPDDAVLAYATQIERAVLTINRRDFVRLHQQGIAHAGIVACTQDADAAGQAQRIDAAVASIATMTNVLLRIVRPNSPPTAGSSA